LRPTDIDEKTGDSVETILRFKHSDAIGSQNPPESLPKYVTTPDFVKVDITADAIEKAARRLGGTDSHSLKHWLLRFGVASQKHSLSPCRLH
jgi:hypothetical protein